MALLCLLFLAFRFLASSTGVGALLSPSEPWLLLGAQQRCWQSTWSHCLVLKQLQLLRAHWKCPLAAARWPLPAKRGEYIQ